MLGDIKSSFTITSQSVSATGATVDATGVDVGAAQGAAFVVTMTAVPTSCDAKLQESDDNSTYTDVSSTDGSGNSGAATQLTAAGTRTLYLVNPRKRYARVSVTNVGACVGVATSILGPLKRVNAP